MSQALNLAQLKKRAKELKKALKAGIYAAAVRVQKSHPKFRYFNIESLSGSEIKLADAQWVIAREAGFVSWPKLRRALTFEAMSEPELEAVCVGAAITGDDARVAEILSIRPELADNSLACSLVLMAPNIHRQLNKQSINTLTGPLQWPPLLYLCGSRYGVTDSTIQGERLELAAALLELGANVNAGVAEMDSVRGFRTALGAAIGCAKNPSLARLLVEAGADVNDGPTLYEGSAMWEAVAQQDLDSLQLLLTHDAPLWQSCHALHHALQFANAALVNLLLQYKADPNWNKGRWGFGGNCLHEAVVLDVEVSTIEVLLDAGAKADFPDRAGRTPLQLAICLNRLDAAALLAKYGADKKQVRDLDRAIGQCFLGGRCSSLNTFSDLKAIDHLWLCRAIRWQQVEASECLIAAGANVNVVDDDGMSPLHLTALINSTKLCQSLLSAGADAGAVNYANQTALDIALQTEGDTEAMIKLLTSRGMAASSDLSDPLLPRLFESAADAVVCGDAERLQSLLQDHPELTRARSPRPHRCTLLNYLGANGVENERQKTPANAPEILHILLQAGSDPNACCYTYRGGPGNNTVGLLTSSSHPKNAGLTLPLTSALMAAGAEVSPSYKVLVQAWNRVRNGEKVLIENTELSGNALIDAAALGEIEVVKAFLDAGVDCNNTNDANITALHLAAIDGNECLVDLLLRYGANPCIRDNQHDGNAVGWALAGGHRKLARKIQQSMGIE